MAIDKLRTQLLQLFNRTQPAIIARGRNGQHSIVGIEITAERNEHRVVADVQGEELYVVELREKTSGSFCSCPYHNQNNAICKHMIAVALRALTMLKNGEVSPTDPDSSLLPEPELLPAALPMDQLLSLLDDLSPASNFVIRSQNPQEKLYYKLIVNQTICSNWFLQPFLASPIDNELKNIQHLHFSEVRQSRMIQLESHDKALLELIPPSYKTYASEPQTPSSLMLALSALRGTDRLRDSVNHKPLHIAPGLWTPKLRLEKTPTGALLQPFLVQDPVREELAETSYIFGKQEKAMLSADKVYLLDTPGWKNTQLSLLTRSHPLSHKHIAQTVMALIRLEGIAEIPAELSPRLIDGTPEPCLHLEYIAQAATLLVALRFRYAPDTNLHSWSSSPRTLVLRDDSTRPLLIRSAPGYESTWLMEFDNLAQNETWSSFIRQDSLRIEAAHVPTFISRVIEPLRQQSAWSLTGLENLRVFQKHPAKVNLRLNSGVDWFDLEGEIQFDNYSAPISSLLALAPETEEVLLPDGSHGLLPRQLVHLLRIVQGLHGKSAKNTAESLRISNLHQSVLKPLLENDDFHIEKRAQLLNQLESCARKPVPFTPPPSTLQATLRSYQEEGFQWLLQMRIWGTGGILADDMGLGKTVQVISVLCDFYQNAKEKRPSIIVMPTSLLHNWKHELERFAPHLTVRTHHGLERETIQPGDCPRCIILTSYAILRNEIETWHEFEFGYAILDESQAIKNPVSQAAVCARELRAAHRLAMTGTPIENNLMDLWSQFAFVNPGLLGSAEFFKREFLNAQNMDADSAPTLDLLGRLTAPFYLRRTKEKVLHDLPPLEERVLYVDLGTSQRTLYNKTRDQFRKKILNDIQSQGIKKSQIHIIEGMLRLRQIACDPRLYLPGSKAGSAKLDLLIEKLCEDVVENHKALVFSQFTTLLNYCGQALTKNGIEFAYLDGSTRNREKAIEEFTATSDKRVFLISLKAGGTGLNLTCADYVFHLDPWWNPAVEAQATGRAHRIGQKNSVQSIKLVASGTIEEKILQLQENKRQLASAILQSDQGFVKSLDTDLVRELFS